VSILINEHLEIFPKPAPILKGMFRFAQPDWSRIRAEPDQGNRMINR